MNSRCNFSSHTHNSASQIEPDSSAIGDESDENRDINCVTPYKCLFEQVYRRYNKHYVCISYKALLKLRRDIVNPPYWGRNGSDWLSLIRVMETGLSQIDILRNQIEVFKKLPIEKSRLHLSIDIFDIHFQKNKIRNIDKLCRVAQSNGICMEQLVFNLAGNSLLDLEILSSHVRELKKLGLQIALSDVDARHFDLDRLIDINPNFVFFNRSWCEFGNYHYENQEFIITLLNSLHYYGISSGLIGIETQKDLEIGVYCGFNSLQGSMFGDPVKRDPKIA